MKEETSQKKKSREETPKKKKTAVTAPSGAGDGSNYTYILKCSDGSLYTGWTNDLEKRVAAHNAGTGSKYTRSRRPVELAYFEEYPTKEEAMRREYEIKHMTRAEKTIIITKR